MSWVLIGEIHTSVVGCDHYKSSKPHSAGAVLSLRRDLGNVFDENAIAVHNGEDCSLATHIGYLPRDLAKILAGGMDKRHIKLAGISTGPCDGYRVPATLMVLSPREQASSYQFWLAKVAFRFRPVEIPAVAERAPAVAGVKRERDAAANYEQEAGSAAAGEAAAAAAAGELQARSTKVKHDSQESGAPLLDSQEDPVEGGLLAVPAVNILPANIDLGSKQVFHGQVCLRFDEQGAATISGTEDTLLAGVLRTWPVLQPGKVGVWTTPPLDDLERYFLGRMLDHMGPLAGGERMPAPDPLNLVIPLRFRPCAADGTPLDGPMIAMGGRPQNKGRQYFAACDSNTPERGRWIWADSSVPWV